jgi:hypothetical protein
MASCAFLEGPGRVISGRYRVISAAPVPKGAARALPLHVALKRPLPGHEKNRVPGEINFHVPLMLVLGGDWGCL